MKYIVKPKWKKSVVIEEIYKHETSNKLCSFATYYRYESYIVTFAKGISVEEVMTWEELDLDDADVVEEYEVYEDADDISFVEGYINNLPEATQNEIENLIDEEGLAWDQIFEEIEGFSFIESNHRLECAVSIEPFKAN